MERKYLDHLVSFMMEHAVCDEDYKMKIDQMMALYGMYSMIQKSNGACELLVYYSKRYPLFNYLDCVWAKDFE